MALISGGQIIPRPLARCGKDDSHGESTFNMKNISRKQNVQSQIRYCEDGLIIPSDWSEDIGSEVSVQKSGQVIIIETKQREMARKRLKKW